MQEHQFQENRQPMNPDHWQQYEYHSSEWSADSPISETFSEENLYPPELAPEQRKAFLKQLKKTGAKCAALLFLLTIIANLVAAGDSWLIQRGISNGMKFTNGMIDFLTSYLPCIVADIVCILLGVVLLRPSRKNLFSSPKPGNSDLIMWGTLACLGAANVGALIFTDFFTFLENIGFSFALPDMAIPRDDWFSSLFSAIYICLLGPVMEEILFRGILLKSLQKYGKMTAIVLSSVGFALFHGNPMQFATPLLVGLVLGFLTLQTNSILPAIVAHIINNTVRTLPLFFVSETSLLVLTISFIIMVIGGIGLIYSLLHYGKEFTGYYREENKGPILMGQKIGKVCTSVWVILYLVLYVVLTVWFFIQFTV